MTAEQADAMRAEMIRDHVAKMGVISEKQQANSDRWLNASTQITTELAARSSTPGAVVDAILADLLTETAEPQPTD